MSAEYACEDCENSFPTPSKLAAHQNRKFPCTSGDFPCNKCPATFTRRSARDRHRKKCSGPKKTFENVQAELEALQAQLAAQTTKIQQAEQKPAAEEASSSQDKPSQPPADASLAVIERTSLVEFEKIRKTSEIPQRVSFDDFTAVPSAAEFYKTSSLKLLCVTNIVNFRSPSIYNRQVVVVFGLDDSYHQYYARDESEAQCPNAVYVAATRASKRLILIHGESFTTTGEDFSRQSTKVLSRNT